MIKGSFAMVGVGAHVTKHDDGSRTLTLVDGELRVVVPLSPKAAQSISDELASGGIIIARGSLPRG